MKTPTPAQNLEKFLECDLNQLAYDLQQGAEMNTDELEWNIRFAEKMFPNSILMLCNARHKDFEYISDVCKDILGYTVEEFQHIMRHGFLQIVHPDDVYAVSLCFGRLAQFAADQKALARMRFMLYYRLRHAHGQYISIADEELVIESRQGKYVGFTLLRDVSATTNFPVVKLEQFVQKANRLIKINEYIPSQNTGAVSAREQDILSLIRQGFSNKDIASRLSLSIHTIKNHKKSVFKKLNVRNSVALMRQTATD